MSCSTIPHQKGKHIVTRPEPQTASLLLIFRELLPAHAVENLIKQCAGPFYRRLFSPVILLWCFIYQRLNPDHTCDAVVSYVGDGGADHLDQQHALPLSQRMQSESSAAYCKGRKRLPLALLQAALQHVVRGIQQALPSQGRWLGHPVLLLDGSSILLTPTPDLVAHYGLHKNGRGNTYWVVARIAAGFCLYSGTLVAVSEDTLRQSEQALAKPVLAQALPDSVCVADSNFGVFSVAQAARHYCLWGLLRLTRQRAQALARCTMQSGEDILITWTPSAKDKVDARMSADPIAGRLVYVRLVRPGFRPVDLYLFTTLRDGTRYPVQQLVELYGRRWQVELNLRYVKATLDLAVLTGKSVDMVRKELVAGLLAYNLMRASIVWAAEAAGQSCLTLSFTRCYRRIRDHLFRPTVPDSEGTSAALHQRLLKRLAQCRLPKRESGRVEPRAVRKRPGVYPALKGSRTEARQRLLAAAKC